MPVSTQDKIKWQHIEELASKIDELAKDRLINDAEKGQEVRMNMEVVKTSLSPGLVELVTDYTTPFGLKLGENAKLGNSAEKFYQRFEFGYYNFKRVNAGFIIETQGEDSPLLQQYVYQPVEGYEITGSDPRYYSNDERLPILMSMWLSTHPDNMPYPFYAVYGNKVVKKELETFTGSIFSASQAAVSNMIETHLKDRYKWWPFNCKYSDTTLISADLYAVLKDDRNCQNAVRLCPICTPEDVYVSYNNNNNTIGRLRPARPYKTTEHYRLQYENGGIEDPSVVYRIYPINNWNEGVTLHEVDYNKYVPETYDISTRDPEDQSWHTLIPPICSSCVKLTFPVCGYEGGQIIPEGDYEAENAFDVEFEDFNFFNKDLLNSQSHSYWWNSYTEHIPVEVDTGIPIYQHERDWVWAEEFHKYEQVSTWVESVCNHRKVYIRYTNLRFMIGDYGNNEIPETDLNIIHQDCVTVPTAIVVESDGYLTTATRKRWYDMLYFKLRTLLGYWYDVEGDEQHDQNTALTNDLQRSDYVPEQFDNQDIQGVTWNSYAEPLLTSKDSPCKRWLDSGLGWKSDINLDVLLTRAAAGSKYWEQFLLALNHWVQPDTTDNTFRIDVVGGWPVVLDNALYEDNCEDPKFDNQVSRPWNGGGSNQISACYIGDRFKMHANTFNILELIYKWLFNYKVKELDGTDVDNTLLAPIDQWKTCSPAFYPGIDQQIDWEFTTEEIPESYWYLQSYSDKPIIDAGCWWVGDESTIGVEVIDESDPENIQFKITPQNLTISGNTPLIYTLSCTFEQHISINVVYDNAGNVDEENSDIKIYTTEVENGEVDSDEINGGWLFLLEDDGNKCATGNTCGVKSGVWYGTYQGGVLVYQHRLKFTVYNSSGTLVLSASEVGDQAWPAGTSVVEYYNCDNAFTINNTTETTITTTQNPNIPGDLTISNIQLYGYLSNNCNSIQKYTKYISVQPLIENQNYVYHYIRTKDVIYRYTKYVVSSNTDTIKSDIQAKAIDLINADTSKTSSILFITTQGFINTCLKCYKKGDPSKIIPIGYPRRLTSNISGPSTSSITNVSSTTITANSDIDVWDGQVNYTYNASQHQLNIQGCLVDIQAKMGDPRIIAHSKSAKSCQHTTEYFYKDRIQYILGQDPDTDSTPTPAEYSVVLSVNNIQKAYTFPGILPTSTLTDDMTMEEVLDNSVSILENLSQNVDYDDCISWIDMTQEDTDYYEFWCLMYQEAIPGEIYQGYILYKKWTQLYDDCQNLKTTRYSLDTSQSISRNAVTDRTAYTGSKDSTIILMNPNIYTNMIDEDNYELLEDTVRGCAVATVWSPYVIPANFVGKIKITVKTPLKRGAVRAGQYRIKPNTDYCESDIPPCAPGLVTQVSNTLSPIPEVWTYGVTCDADYTKCPTLTDCNEGGALYCKPWIVGAQFNQAPAAIGTVQSIAGDGPICRNLDEIENQSIQDYVNSADTSHTKSWEFDVDNKYGMRIVAGCTLILNSYDTTTAFTDLSNLQAYMFTPILEPVLIEIELIKQ